MVREIYYLLLFSFQNLFLAMLLLNLWFYNNLTPIIKWLLNFSRKKYVRIVVQSLKELLRVNFENLYKTVMWYMTWKVYDDVESWLGICEVVEA